MDCVLHSLLWVCCLVYLDDIVIYSSESIEGHIVKLAAVQERLDTASMSLKSSKRTFGSKKIVYLGHDLNENGVRPFQRIVK